MAKKTKKKVKKPKLKDFVSTVLAEGEKCVHFDNAPKFTNEPYLDLVAVGYIERVDHTLSMFITRDGKTWREEKTGIRPNKAAAVQHLENLRWVKHREASRGVRKVDVLPVDRERLRKAVRLVYDLQKLRIGAGNRDSDQSEPVVLEPEDKTFMGNLGLGLEHLEKDALAEVEHLLMQVPMYTQYLKPMRGVGPAMGGVLLAEIDITKCETSSQLWAYCGLHVDAKTGKAMRREKGKKANWNSFLKTKALFVLGGNLKKNANEHYCKLYDDYRHRKENTFVSECMLCKGKGVAVVRDEERKRERDEQGNPLMKEVTCYNCDGGKLTKIPWGNSDAHRDLASKRYMVKQFLLDFWMAYREREGLPVTESYAVAKLGMNHGDHAPIETRA